MLAKVLTALFVGGQWRPSADGATFDGINSATAEPLASVAAAAPEDGVAAAVAAAHACRPRPGPRARAEILRRGVRADAALRRPDRAGER